MPQPRYLIQRQDITDPQRCDGQKFHRVVIKDLSSGKPVIVSVGEALSPRTALAWAKHTAGLSCIKNQKNATVEWLDPSVREA
jgi:hypothetical protein